MALYKNREVSIVGPSSMANTPETINVQYKDGSHENVSISAVQFTADEKKSLQKNYPSKYDSVAEAAPEDISAVQSGVAPPSDPVVQEQAKAKVKHQKQVDAAAKQQKSVEDSVAKEPVNPPVTSTPVATTTLPVPNKVN